MLAQVAEAAARNVSLKDYEIRLLMTPLPGYDALATKTLVMLNAKDKRLKLFVKISNSPKLSYLLENEADSLAACANLGIGGVPQILARGSIGGRFYLAQKYEAGRKMHAQSEYLDTAMAKTKDWLVRLYEKTRGPSIEPTDLVRRAGEYARPALGIIDLSDCLAMMERMLPQTPMPTHRVHGDFWHGNILLQGEAHICVTDFAFSALGEPPLDCLDLICDYDPSIFLNKRRLKNYSQYFSFENGTLLFLHIYALIRKIGLKVDRRRKLYDELLINNLESSMNEISEIGIVKRAVRHYETEEI